jgi:hypothetical protein
MPSNSSEKSTEERSDLRPGRNWTGIGINAVAAASMCKSTDRDRREQAAQKGNFPFAETEYATD